MKWGQLKALGWKKLKKNPKEKDFPYYKGPIEADDPKEEQRA